MNEFHPIANIFPLMGAEDLDSLATDISENGQQLPIIRHKDGRIIDGRNRWLACQRLGIEPAQRTFDGPDDNLLAYVISLNVKLRHLNESQRGLIAAELAKGKPGNPQWVTGCSSESATIASIEAIGQPEAGLMLNVSRTTVQRARLVLDRGTPEIIADVRNGKRTLNAAIAQIRDNERKEAFHESICLDLPNLHIGDFRELAHIIPAATAELVFTDPPYDRDAIPLYEAAAREAARILKPGGSFITYCGNVIIPDVIPLMRQHLRYFWTAACIHKDGDGLITKYGIHNGWKPLFWFVKGSRGDPQTFIDDTVSGGKEKDSHEWQQAESEAMHFIKNLTSENGLVVDFFAGGGTTPVAAQRLGRPWIAFEINPASASKIYERISHKGANNK